MVWGKNGVNLTNFHGARRLAEPLPPGGSMQAHMLNLLVKARVLFKNKISKISIMSFPNPREIKMQCFPRPSSYADIFKYQLPVSLPSFRKETVRVAQRTHLNSRKPGPKPAQLACQTLGLALLV